ncbi:hypothetical protein [Paenibacillus jilunlii]|uniref:Restriction endonuclease NotI n=1 Tax=Paenibacillus jilunlii TaxID=682956 RepID=A0A1G9WKD6_9BACL|nr:hypothetical protein [Paenibacillus jilunlii]KWX73548.1 hypothetical protein AML91_17900 [Paenibacillus jilunlii]SDM84626.1 hypothetical protein SAMN05216191_11997 [Paenibacillus jilunlii]
MAGVTVAEYLGQRTDIDLIKIEPAGQNELCPFMEGKLCHKKVPVCSIRNKGKLWIVCENRLCSSKKTIPDPAYPKNKNKKLKLPLSAYQKEVLLNIARASFSDTLNYSDVAVKREVSIKANDLNNYSADFVMTLHNGKTKLPGPDRVVLEMQGGGETSNTGLISNHLALWASDPHRTNEMLREEIKNVGTIETNAWRRQQEQFIVKGNVAMMTWKGYGIIFCVGELLYDYIWRKIENKAILPPLKEHNWTLAFLEICEDHNKTIVPGPLPLKIGRRLFTNYHTFVHALINQGEPSPETFAGEFDRLDGTVVNIPREGN